MQNFLSTLVICTITMSMAALLPISLSPLLSRKYEAKWQYYTWLVINIGFIIPVSPHINFAFFKVNLPAVQPKEIWSIDVQDFVMATGSEVSRLLKASTVSSEEELSFILEHELIHYKRKDVGDKSMVMLAAAIHRFNPVVYLMARSITLQCELSCDAEVMKNA